MDSGFHPIAPDGRKCETQDVLIVATAADLRDFLLHAGSFIAAGGGLRRAALTHEAGRTGMTEQPLEAPNPFGSLVIKLN